MHYPFMFIINFMSRLKISINVCTIINIINIILFYINSMGISIFRNYKIEYIRHLNILNIVTIKGERTGIEISD